MRVQDILKKQKGKKIKEDDKLTKRSPTMDEYAAQLESYFDSEAYKKTENTEQPLKKQNIHPVEI